MVGAALTLHVSAAQAEQVRKDRERIRELEVELASSAQNQVSVCVVPQAYYNYPAQYFGASKNWHPAHMSSLLVTHLAWHFMWCWLPIPSIISDLAHNLKACTGSREINYQTATG